MYQHNKQQGAGTVSTILTILALLATAWYLKESYRLRSDGPDGPRQGATVERTHFEVLDLGQPKVVHGVAMVPMREAFAALNATVHLDAKKDLVVAVLPGVTVTLRPGARRGMINGEDFLMSRPSALLDGSLYVTRLFVEEVAQRSRHQTPGALNKPQADCVFCTATPASS